MGSRRVPIVFVFLGMVLLSGCAGRLTELDSLERTLDEIGTITVKQPDVWGEARLTRHRQELEEALGKRVGGFRDVISAHIRRSDAASLTGAGAVGVGQIFAPGVEKPVVERPELKLEELQPGLPQLSPLRDTQKTPTGTGGGLEPNQELRQEQSYIGVNHALRRINAGDDIGQLPGYAVYLLRFPISVMPGSKTRAGYRAQVTLSLGLDPAQLNYLVAEETFGAALVEAVVNELYRRRAEKARAFLRRGPTPSRKETEKALRDLFEADDYGVSFSVQAPPFGPDPQEGHFHLALAEAADALIAADLDRAAIESVIERHLTANRDALARAAADALIKARGEDPKAFRMVPDRPSQYQPLTLSFLRDHRLNRITIDSSRMARLAARFPETNDWKDQKKRPGLQSQIMDEIKTLLSEPEVVKAARAQYAKVITDRMEREQRILTVWAAKRDPEAVRDALFAEFRPDDALTVTVLNVPYPFRLSYAGHQVDELRWALVNGEIERVRSLVALAVLRPSTEEAKTSREKSLSALPSAWMKRMRGRVGKYIDRFLHERHAEGLRPEHRDFIQTYVDRVLEEELRDEEKRERAAQIKAELGHWTNKKQERPILHTWFRLLYERFDPFAEKAGLGIGCQPPGGQVGGDTGCPPIGLRDLLTELLVRALFEYETPIQAFALDPVLEEQNAVDIFSRRRDLQLAMAFAVTSGKISGKAAGDLVRRLELDIDTIALNRTVTAFNMGQASFGWVFSPRIQTPPDESFFEWLNPVKLWTPERTRDRARLELEPGTREVHVIVAVPAYLQEMEATATVNWIPVTNPGKPMFPLSEAVRRHSEAVQAERAWYRRPDYERWEEWGMMTGRLRALQRKGPLQRFIIRLPYDHTSSIIGAIQGPEQASLAPVVTDVVPSQGPEDRDTDVFVSGTNFDINSTRVIVGGQEVRGEDVKLMSRRLIKARLPKSPHRDAPVQLYVATPWGRSNGHPFTYLQAKKPDQPQPVTGTLMTKTLEVITPDLVKPAEVVIRLSGPKRGASTDPGKSKIAIVDSKGGVILLSATYEATVVGEAKVDQVVSGPKTDSVFARKVAALAAGEVSSIKIYVHVNGVDEEVPVSGSLIVAKQ